VAPRRSLLLVALALALLCATIPSVHSQEDPSSEAPAPASAPAPEPVAEEAPPAHEEHITDILQDTVNDITDTVLKSPNAIGDLKAKYQEHVMKLVGGSIIGYTAGAVVKFFSMSVLKVACVTIVGFIGLIGSGVIGKDSSKVVDYAYEKMSKFDTNKASKEAYKRMDLNKDGKINGKDVVEGLKRAEQLLLKNNLALSTGAIVGGALGLWR